MKIINCCYIHLIMRIEPDQSPIMNEWKKFLEEYITIYLRRHEQRTIAINSHIDHIHILFALHENTSVDEVVSMVMSATKQFATSLHASCNTVWSEDYICLSVAGSDIEDVSRHIRRQDEIHRTKSLATEINDLMDQIESDIPAEFLNDHGFLMGPPDYSAN